MEKKITFTIQTLKQKNGIATISRSNHNYFNKANALKQVCTVTTLGNISTHKKLLFFNYYFTGINVLVQLLQKDQMFIDPIIKREELNDWI